MSKYGFLDVLEEELDKDFPFDFEINWDKRESCGRSEFSLRSAKRRRGCLGRWSRVKRFWRGYLLWRSRPLLQSSQVACGRRCLFDGHSLWAEKGLSREFLAYFATFLKDTAEVGLGCPHGFLSRRRSRRALRSSGTKKSLKKERLAWKKETFTLIRDIRNKWRVYEKKIGIYLVYGLSFVLLMAGFCLGDDRLYGVGFSTGFCTGLSLHFSSMYLIFILHELGHAFCGYLTGYRLVALGLGSFLLTKKQGSFVLVERPFWKMLVPSILD